MSEWFEAPGWGVVFAAWTLSAAIGAVVVAAAALLALRGRARRRREGPGR